MRIMLLVNLALFPLLLSCTGWQKAVDTVYPKTIVTEDQQCVRTLPSGSRIGAGIVFGADGPRMVAVAATRTKLTLGGARHALKDGELAGFGPVTSRSDFMLDSVTLTAIEAEGDSGRAALFYGNTTSRLKLWRGVPSTLTAPARLEYGGLRSGALAGTATLVIDPNAGSARLELTAADPTDAPFQSLLWEGIGYCGGQLASEGTGRVRLFNDAGRMVAFTGPGAAGPQGTAQLSGYAYDGKGPKAVALALLISGSAGWVSALIAFPWGTP